MNLKAKQAIDKYAGRTAVAISLVFVRLLGIWMKRDHSLSKDPDHILVIKMLGIGSVLMASDSIHSLRLRYPKAKFILLCGKGISAGIEPLGLFDEIWVNDDSNLGKMLSSGIGALIKTWRLKNLWVLDLEVYSVMTTLFSTWTMALNRFGFILNKVQFRDQLNTHSVYFNQFITVNQNYNKLAMAMGAQEVKPFVFHPPLISNPYKTKAIALNNTCSDLGDIVRKLPDHSFAFIIQHLLKHSDYQIILTGSPRDAAGIDGFLKKYFPNQPERLSNIAGQFSFKDYYSLLGHHCKAMITIDSAPFHIAVRLDLPSLSFWGPINPKQRLKFEDYNKHFYYYLKKDCSPCIHHTDVLPCGGDNICMKHMEKPDIGQKLDELLSFIK